MNNLNLTDLTEMEQILVRFISNAYTQLAKRLAYEYSLEQEHGHLGFHDFIVNGWDKGGYDKKEFFGKAVDLLDTSVK